METRRIKLTDLLQNEGQIDGLPRNPRQWKKSEVTKLARSINETPELLEARGLIVYPYGGKFIILGGNMRYSALKSLKAKDAPCFILDAATSIEKLTEINRIYNSATGSRQTVSGSCQGCVLNLLRDCGRLYFAAKDAAKEVPTKEAKAKKPRKKQ